ncbi:UNVERIFIED_CONTAM: hypothetical protein FKN15_061247 [Acipenser sinensis]
MKGILRAEERPGVSLGSLLSGKRDSRRHSVTAVSGMPSRYYNFFPALHLGLRVVLIM